MTKRRLERDLEDQRDLLEDLSPDERLEVFLKAMAEDRDNWTEALGETAPQRHYRMTEYAYTERKRVAMHMRQDAVYKLHTTFLQFQTAQERQSAQGAIDSDKDPSDATLPEADERADRLQTLFGELYMEYHAYRQFAENELGVDLETWLSSYRNGELIVRIVEGILEDSQLKDNVAEELKSAETELDDGEEATLDDIATNRYEAYAEMWNDATDEL